MSNFCPLVAIGGDSKLSRTNACGGAVLWLELLRRSGAFRNLAMRVAGAQGWSDGQIMLTVLLLNVVGTNGCRMWRRWSKVEACADWCAATNWSFWGWRRGHCGAFPRRARAHLLVNGSALDPWGISMKSQGAAR